MATTATTTEGAADDTVAERRQESMHILASVQSALDKITSAKHLTSESVVLSDSYASCEDMLLPAPMAIMLTAKLILISNKHEFNLKKPDGGFKYLKGNSTFRSSLIGVAHELQNAFRNADGNMEAVCLSVSQMPAEFNKATKILTKMTNEEVNVLLDVPLTAIKVCANECLRLANETEGKYTFVTNMTAELIEAIIDTEKETKEELTRAGIQREFLAAREKDMKQKQQENDERRAQLMKEVEEADKKFRKSQDDSTNVVWKMAVMETVFASVRSAIDMAPMGFASGRTFMGMKCMEKGLQASFQAFAPGQKPEAKSAAQEKASTERKDGDDDIDHVTDEEAAQIKLEEADYQVLSRAGMIYEYAMKLRSFLEEDGCTLSETALQQNQEDYACSLFFLDAKREMKKLLPNFKAQQLLDVCSLGFRICDRIARLRKASDKVDKDALTTDISKLEKATMVYSAQAKCVLGKTPADGGILKVSNEQTTLNMGYAHIAAKQAHFKVQQDMEYLKAKQQELDKCNAERRQLADELTEKIAELNKINIDEVDFKKAKECLHEGLVCMSMLRERWQLLTEFFKSMSNLIDTALKQKATSFVALAQRQQLLQASKTASIDGTKTLRQMIYEEAFGAVKIAIVVKNLAEGYKRISHFYLMPQVRALDRMLTAQDANTATVQLDEERQKAEQGIRLELQQSKNKVHKELSERLTELERIQNEALPPISAQDRMEIKEMAAIGVGTTNTINIPVDIPHDDSDGDDETEHASV